MDVAQLVRASDCGSEGRGFEPRFPPTLTEVSFFILFRFVLGNHVFYIRDFFVLRITGTPASPENRLTRIKKYDYPQSVLNIY